LARSRISLVFNETVKLVRNAGHQGAYPVMRHVSIFVLAIALFAGLARTPALAVSDETTKGKTCRMEQQCRWENFKKICTYTIKFCAWGAHGRRSSILDTGHRRHPGGVDRLFRD
jgi:hypothetical protein